VISRYYTIKNPFRLFDVASVASLTLVLRQFNYIT